MNLKKIKIFGFFGILGLSFLFHFLYEWVPNNLFAIFFPVNESVWEHMKMLFSAIVFYGIIDYFLLNKFKIDNKNFLLSLFISALSSIVIYLIIYLPIYYNFGESMLINITILIITIVLIQIISFFIMKIKYNKILNVISLILIIISYIIMGYLTYNPPKHNIFYDPSNEKYGINNYNI